MKLEVLKMLYETKYHWEYLDDGSNYLFEHVLKVIRLYTKKKINAIFNIMLSKKVCPMTNDISNFIIVQLIFKN